MHNIGKRIARLRRKQGFTQAFLAKIVGVSDKAVSKWERGESLPDIAMISSLSFALQTNCEYLIHGPRCPASIHGELSRFQYALGQLEAGSVENALPVLQSVYENINKEFKSELQIATERLTNSRGTPFEKQALCADALRIALKEGEEALPEAAYLNAYQTHLSYIIEQDRPVICTNIFCTRIQKNESRFEMFAGFGMGNRGFAPFLEKNLLEVGFCSFPPEGGIPLLDEQLQIEEHPLSVKEILSLPRSTPEYIIKLCEKQTVMAPAGRFENCTVFRRLLKTHFGARVLEEAFCPGVGLVRSDIYAPAGKTTEQIDCFTYLLCNYSVAPDESLFPLAVHNRWCYELQGEFPYATQRMIREVFAARTVNGKQEYLLMVNDDFLYDLDYCATLSPKELFALSARSDHRHSKILLEKLFTPRVPIFYKDMAESLWAYQDRFSDTPSKKFGYLKRDILDASGVLCESIPSSDTLLYTKHGPYKPQFAAFDEHTVLNVFRHAPLFEGKIFCEEWVDGYEHTFQKEIFFPNTALLLAKQLWHQEKDFEKWCTAQQEAEKKGVCFHCHVKVQKQRDFTAGERHYEEVLEVIIECRMQEELPASSEMKDRALIQTIPQDLCGVRTLYFAKNIGLVAVAEEIDQKQYFVFLESYSSRAHNSSYFPLHIGNRWCYCVMEEGAHTTACYTLRHEQTQEQFSFMKEFLRTPRA